MADPVQLKPAGEHAAFPLRYFDKRRRTNAGSWVFVSAGGKAELLWPDNGTTVVLFDLCTGIVGSPSSGEPNFILRDVQRAEFMLSDGDQIELMGGALLTADSGPWLVERRSFDILRVKNQSKEPGEVAYREANFVISPGHAVDLPLGTTGGAPSPEIPGTVVVPGPGFDLRVYGDVDSSEIAKRECRSREAASTRSKVSASTCNSDPAKKPSSSVSPTNPRNQDPPYNSLGNPLVPPSLDPPPTAAPPSDAPEEDN